MEYVRVHLAALEKELEQGEMDSEIIPSLLEYIDGIKAGKRIKGSNYRDRQQALWQLGNRLLEAGLIHQTKGIVKRMSSTSSKRKLRKRLRDLESGEA
jgi:hypothetical protein